MIDDGTLSLLLGTIITGAFTLWGIYSLISKDFRELIIYWRRRFSKGSIIVRTREEYERLRERNRQAARQGQRVRPVGYIHLDPDLKFYLTLLNILTFVVIILGIISLLSFRNNILSSLTIGSFIVLVGMYFLFGIFQLKKF